MSDYRAIQGVTTTIKNILEKFMFLNRAGVLPADRVEVTTKLPDQDTEGKRVNLFLYHIRECPYLSNQDLPGAAHPSEYGFPPLSLDLHYLVTAYTASADDDQFEAHQILGDAMRTLRDHAYLLGNVLDPALESAVERAKVTLEPLTVEDVTKIWIALSSPYRLSAGYKVTVVQLQSRIERSAGGLIGETPAAGPRIAVVPMQRPRIDEVLIIRLGDATNRERVAYGRIGDRLVLKGQNLSGKQRLMLNDVDVSASILSKTPSRMEATLPDNAALQPGPIPIRLAVEILIGEPAVPHSGISSNVSAMVLIPSVTALNVTPGNPATLDIQGTRLFQENKECSTLIGDHVVLSSDYTTHLPGHVVLAAPKGLPAGNYPVRVRVNGADSIETQTLVI